MKDLFKIGDRLTHKDRDGVIYNVGVCKYDDDCVYIYWIVDYRRDQSLYNKKHVNELLHDGTWINITGEEKEKEEKQKQSLRDKLLIAIKSGFHIEWAVDENNNTTEYTDFSADLALERVIEVLEQELIIKK